MTTHTRAHVLGRDIDIDVGTGWIIGIAALATVLVAAGVVMLARGDDDGGLASFEVPTPAAQPVTPSERLADAKARLNAYSESAGSPAVNALAVSQYLAAQAQVDEQARDDRLELDRMLARPR